MALKNIGWQVSAERKTRVIAETLKSRWWSVSRVWSASGEFIGLPLPAGTLRVVIGIEGEAELYAREKVFALPRRHLIVLGNDEPVKTVCSGSWARFHWNINCPKPAYDYLIGLLGKPIYIDGPYWHVATSLTASLTPRNDDSGIPGTHIFGDVFLAILTGMASTRLGVDAAAVTPLYADALQVIDARHREIAFSVATLAQALSVSGTHLHRIFAHAGTTPGRELERRRVLTAMMILESTPEYARSRVANSAGFSSTKRLLHARRRQLG